MEPKPGSVIARILCRIAAALLLVGSGPLVAYVIFGPKDGNPVGLGLLFVFSFPIAAALFLAGWGIKALARLRGGTSPAPPLPARVRRPVSGSDGHWP